MARPPLGARVAGSGLGAARGVLRLAATAWRTSWWRVLDYGYVVRLQVVGALSPRGADAFRRQDHPVPPDVVLVPGVYESWHFLRPLARRLHAAGHRVHVLSALGYNRAPVETGARVLGDHLRVHDLRDVVVVAHSKGGLIGKLAMLQEDPEERIRCLVAVGTPFVGSHLARFFPLLPAVRAFVPSNPLFGVLAAEAAVHSRIVSAYSVWDPHIPGGSELLGARNVVLATPGHFRVLADEGLKELVDDVVADAAP
ncbi:triacylglycerol lipase [Actinotalea sp. Marseille-Q4924]|uniref:esterase/lipase family protein n=1 Tax=Actinotalea sp. Marseille-Q4924 TaxID=2866571 RepID=UPI001CE49C4B|nr:alpha/beta hydrolase [Actinotalea sp. Marseille-Q4924]